MLTGLAVVLLLLSSHLKHASSDEDILVNIMTGSGLFLFKTILDNLPTNQTDYDSSYIFDTCLSDLMQIHAQLRDLDTNALQSKFASVRLYFSEFGF